MSKKRNDIPEPDKRKAAVCGLFCPSCSLYIGTTEEPQRLNKLAEMLNQPVEATKCEGCRADVRTSYCQTCKIYACAASKGIDFCVECSDFSCDELQQFQSVLPHRLELWQSQARIKEVGWEQWYKEMVEHFSCSGCGTVNSAYDRGCRKCGGTPSCEYVKVNNEGILKRMPKQT